MQNLIEKIINRIKSLDLNNLTRKDDFYLADIGLLIERYARKRENHPEEYVDLMDDQEIFNYKLSENEYSQLSDFFNNLVLENIHRNDNVLLRLMWVLSKAYNHKYLPTFQKLISYYLEVNYELVEQALYKGNNCYPSHKEYLQVLLLINEHIQNGKITNKNLIDFVNKALIRLKKNQDRDL